MSVDSRSFLSFLLKHNAAAIPDNVIEQCIDLVNESIQRGAVHNYWKVAFQFLLDNNLIPQGVTREQVKHRVKTYALKKGIPLLIPGERGGNVRNARHAAKGAAETSQQDNDTHQSDSAVPISSKRTKISPTTSIVSVLEDIGDVASSPAPTPSPETPPFYFNFQPSAFETETDGDRQMAPIEKVPKPVEQAPQQVELWMLNTEQLIEFLLAKHVNLPTKIQEHMRKEDIDGEVFVQLSEMDIKKWGLNLGTHVKVMGWIARSKPPHLRIPARPQKQPFETNDSSDIRDVFSEALGVIPDPSMVQKELGYKKVTSSTSGVIPAVPELISKIKRTYGKREEDLNKKESKEKNKLQKEFLGVTLKENSFDINKVARIGQKGDRREDYYSGLPTEKKNYVLTNVEEGRILVWTDQELQKWIRTGELPQLDEEETQPSTSNNNNQ